jgi:hypothetical protein
LCVKSPIPTPSLLFPAPSPPPSLPSLASVPGVFAVKKSALAAPAAVAALVVLATIPVAPALALHRQKCPVLKLPAALLIVAVATAILAKKTPRHSPHSHRCSCRKTPRRSANSRRECRCCTSSLKPLHTAPYSSTQLHASSSGSCKKAPRHSPRSYRYAGKKASSCSNSELTEMPRTQTLSISPHSRRARGCCTSSPRPPRYLQQSDAHRPCCSCCRNDLCSVPDPPFLWCILVLVLPWMHHECAQECHRAANYRSP